MEGVTGQRAAAKRLGISSNTVKKYWEGNAVPWDRKEYSREAAVMTPEVDSVHMPRPRMTIGNCQPTIALSLFSAIQPPEMKKGW